jgi:hypothetical protein
MDAGGAFWRIIMNTTPLYKKKNAFVRVATIKFLFRKEPRFYRRAGAMIHAYRG